MNKVSQCLWNRNDSNPPVGLTRFSSTLVFLLLVIVLVTTTSEGREKIEKWGIFKRYTTTPSCSSPPPPPIPPEIDDHLADQLIDCRRNLKPKKGIFESLDLFHSEVLPICSKDTSRKKLLSKGNLQKSVSILDSQRKQTVLGCIRKHNVGFHVSGEKDGSKRWYAQYWSNVSRQCLGSELLSLGVSKVGIPTPFPGVEPPIYGSTPYSGPTPYPGPGAYLGPTPYLAPSPVSSQVPNP